MGAIHEKPPGEQLMLREKETVKETVELKLPLIKIRPASKEKFDEKVTLSPLHARARK